MKEYRFETSLQHHGNAGATIRIAGKSELQVAPPPAFHGPEGVWSPEDLFVAAVESCLMITFAHLAQGRGLRVHSSRSRAVGVLVKDQGGLHFTRVEVYPAVTIDGGPDEVQAARDLLHQAERVCLVARSLSAEVKVFPFVEAAGIAAIVGED